MIQTVVEGRNITINLQSVGRPDPFPPLISSQLNSSLLSNTGVMVTVNDYNVSFINVQRNQSGNYTLTVSNDAGATNTTFILNVQCKCVHVFTIICIILFLSPPPVPPEAIPIGPDLMFIQSDSSVTISLFTNINGNPTPTVTWIGSDNNTITNGGNFTVDNIAGTLSINTFTSDDNGTYTVTVSNGIGTPLVNMIQLIIAGNVTLYCIIV